MRLLLVIIISLICIVNTNAQSTSPPPTQQRISLLPDGMTVSWTTVGSLSGEPTVRFGRRRSTLDHVATGYSLHYDPATTWWHHVHLRDLEPDTTYYWQVTNPWNASSPILSFITRPREDAHASVHVAINGDMGLNRDGNTIKMMTKWSEELDLFWHVGDLAYADDWKDLKSTYEDVMETWFTEMTPIWDHVPYMYCPGNHEAGCLEGSGYSSCPIGQNNFTSYRSRISLPHRESGSPSNMFYSFDYGLVHFINIDTEVSFKDSPEGNDTWANAGPFGDQYAWLREDLRRANENRRSVPWILVAGHRPFYSSTGSSGTWAPSQPFFEPLFLEFNVDIVFWGHVHWYERMYPTNNGTVCQKDYNNPKCPVYFISASAGNVEGLTKGKIVQDYTAFLNDEDYGAGRLHVLNATYAHWEFVRSNDTKVLDEIIITKSRRMESEEATHFV